MGRLRKAAHVKGLKQQALADLMGVNLDRVKSIFGGKVKKLDPQEVLALEEKIHLRPDYLLRGDEPMFKSEAEQKVFGALRVATNSVAALALPDWVKRLAQEWSFALERGDAKRLLELATMTSGPDVRQERASYTAPVKLDTELLQAVANAAFAEIESQKKRIPPAKLSELIVLLYESSENGQVVNPATVKRLVKLAS